MTFLVELIYSGEVNTCMCKRCRNMVNLSEQSLPKPILYTVLDLLIRLIDNDLPQYTSKPCFINHCYHMCGNKYYLYLLTVPLTVKL